MYNSINDILKGKTFELKELSFSCDENILNLWMKLIADKEYAFDFYNVSDFSLNKLCASCKVCGLRITSNENFGWWDSVKYEVRDYQDDIISFYCEDFAFRQL